MNNDAEMLATLQRILKLQEESHAIQKQSYELQQKAVENQARAIANQMATSRLYRIALVAGALIMAGLLFVLIKVFN
ncbi:MAG TPA: hypothetical protein VIT91_02670 [Chthoniobacterales bacterium]